MRQLSAEDARFLYADTDHSNSNLTLVVIYDPSTAPGGHPRFLQLLQHVASRVHLSPVFRQRLYRVPLEFDLPYWVEDDRFDLEYHVRHVALPAPGDWRQFCIQLSRIHARPLDLARPLWEMYLVDRLDSIDGLPKDSFAVLLKLHHAAVDLGESTDLLNLLHDTSAEALPPPPPEPWFPEPPPAITDLVLRGIRNAAPFANSQAVVKVLARLNPHMLALLGESILNPERFPLARFNAEVSPHRVFETRRFEAWQFEAIRRLVRGATLDDAVLAVCGGALRRYLDRSDELPKASLVALAPVHAIGAGREGLESAFRRVGLGTDVADPVARLRAIHRATGQAREATPLEDPVRPDGHEPGHEPANALALVSRALGQAGRAAARGVPIASCTVAHVPGPAVPQFLLGARATYFSATMPVADGIGLTIAVTTYDDKVLISPTACREQLPDPEAFAQCIRDSFQEYLAVAEAKGIAGKTGLKAPAQAGKRAAAGPKARPKLKPPRRAARLPTRPRSSRPASGAAARARP